ncbi:MAG: hypothetical protein EXS31_03015 [Pedosphaera sp.]|nr:hypothetical protein [Pedosphaera sp.]
MAMTIATHAQVAPKLVSVTPADGTAGVVANITLVFVFDQPLALTSIPLPGLNFEILPATVSFAGAVSADRRTATFTSSKALPTDTRSVGH